MIRPEHPFDIRPDLRKAASTKAESTCKEPGGSTLYCLNLVDAVLFAGAPYAECIF